MPHSGTYRQDQGEGTGAPESPALFLMVLSWSLKGLGKYDRVHVPTDIYKLEK